MPTTKPKDESPEQSADTEAEDQTKKTPTELEECFVIMPISDPDGYEKGHFKRVYDDIFKPAIIKAGLRPTRADEEDETDIIHVNILRKLLHAPMALCDLSTRNPNVLFELGLRQAFDKPVTLVCEDGTGRIFDVDILRHINYGPQLDYRRVLKDQESIFKAIKATYDASKAKTGANSLLRLLSIDQPATLQDVTEAEKDPVYQLLSAQISALSSEISRSNRVRGRVQAVNYTSQHDLFGNIIDSIPSRKSTKAVPDFAAMWPLRKVQIMKRLPAHLKDWFDLAVPAEVDTDTVILKIQAQDTLDETDTQFLEDAASHVLDKQCFIMYEGIPSG